MRDSTHICKLEQEPFLTCKEAHKPSLLMSRSFSIFDISNFKPQCSRSKSLS